MKTPKPLKKGDAVGIMAMASKLDWTAIEPALQILENWGLQVEIGQSVGSAYHQFAGTDEIRAMDFQMMLDKPHLKAIFSARGGYGSSRIIDCIDFRKFKRHPKWIIGFSDITAVHCHLHRMGYESIHATMPKLFNEDGGTLAVKTLQDILFGKSLSYQIPAHPLNRLGEASGRLIGGNLTLLAHIIGSKSDVSYKDKILFIEDVGEAHYSLDRMLLQLRRANKLSQLAGLIVGQFSSLNDTPADFGKTAFEIVAEHVQDYQYPVSYDFPIGHVPNNWAMPCGRMLTILVENEKVILQE
jgi:muramoyltetrapeptide carboxypeptidase